MSNLFQISKDLLMIFESLEVDEETGEILNLGALEEATYQFESKVEALALFIEELLGEADTLKAKEQALKERRISKENKAKSLKKYLSDSMLNTGKTLIETDLVRLSFRRSEVVEVSEDFDSEEFMQVKTTITPDKAKIKAAIKSGQGPEGAILVEKQNLQIK